MENFSDIFRSNQRILFKQSFAGKEQYEKIVSEQRNRNGLNSDSASSKLESLVLAFEEAGKTDSPLSVQFVLQQCLGIITDLIVEDETNPNPENSEINFDLIDDLTCKDFAEQLEKICKILWAEIARPYDEWKHNSLLLICFSYSRLVRCATVIHAHVDPKSKLLCAQIMDELEEIFVYEEFKCHLSSPFGSLKINMEKYETADQIIESSSNDSCPVCLDCKFEAKTAFIVLENCNHLICHTCFTQFENLRIEHCPLCRRSLGDTFTILDFQRLKIMSEVFREGRNKPYFQNLFKNLKI